MKTNGTKLFRCWDILVYACIVLVAALLFCFGLKSSDTSSLVVKIGNEEKVYSLQNDRVFNVKNNGHTMVVQIKDGTVSVKSTDCPDKVCLHSGAISRTSQIIVCAPAEISLRIVGNEKGEYDAITS